ncbi:DUF2892 domain-containing protein [Vampirovibrio sp.]|uniref:YgaP family membrane protein n=1 Tax=Vampirovibrio sp. TaxID=2717857 RepID=UPI0035940AB6
MTTASFDQNVGGLDRVIRGIFGTALIYRGISRKNSLWKGMGLLMGALLAIPSITGHDPVLKQFGASTRFEDENFILNILKKAKPGHGINPILTEQPSPNIAFKPHEKQNTLSDMLAIQ